MLRLALLGAAAAVAVGFASCDDGKRASVEACVAPPSASAGAAIKRPAGPLLGLLQLPNTAVVLARLDPLSLEPVSRQVLLGEYHDAWSVSPDRSHAAFGISAPGRRRRIGVRIVDLAAMKVVREVETGILAGALAWLTPRRLVAALERGGTALVDPRTGRILRRWPRLSEPRVSARIPDALAMLVPTHPGPAADATVTTRLAVIDARARLRSVALERIRIGGIESASAVGLAVDPNRARAYVVAADAPVAEVDLGTMRVSHHLELPGPDVELESVSARQRRALWLGDGQVLVFGRDYVVADNGEIASVAAGAMLVNTATWSACMLDERASGAVLAAGRVLVYGPGPPVSRDAAGVGLRAYTAGGRELFHLFDGEQVWDVQVRADLAYVRTPNAVHVVDIRAGRVVRAITPPPDLVGVIAEPT